jgi:hypothetical protein
LKNGDANYSKVKEPLRKQETCTKKIKHTRVVNLYLLFPRKASKVSHQAVVFGAAFTNSSFTNSSIFKSTARDGLTGAHGKNPSSRS